MKTLSQLLEEKGFTGDDYSITNGEVIPKTKLRVVEVIHHPALAEFEDEEGTVIQEYKEAWDEEVKEPYTENIPTTEQLYGELLGEEGAIQAINHYLKDKERDILEDSINTALFISGDDSGWRMKAPAPTRKQLYEMLPALQIAQAQDLQAKRIQAAGEAISAACRDAFNFITGYNGSRGLNIAQIDEMEESFAPIATALQRNRIDKAYKLISEIEPDGVLVTQELIDVLLSKLTITL